MADTTPIPAPPPGAVPPPLSPGKDWRKLHLWQIQPVRDLMLIGVVVLIVYVGYKLKIVTVPLLVAMLLAYIFEPLVARATRRGLLSRRGVVIGIIATVLLLIVTPLTIGGGYAAIQGVSIAGEVSHKIRGVLRSVEKPDDPGLRAVVTGSAWIDIRDWLVKRRGAAGQAPESPARDPSAPQPLQSPTTPDPPATDEVSPDETSPTDADPAARTHSASFGPPEPTGARLLTTVMSWIEQNAAGLASSLGKSAVGSGAQAIFVVLGTFASIGVLFFSVFLTMFFFYFLSTGWGRVLDQGAKLIPDAGKYRWMRVIRRMDRAIAGFVRGRLTICAIIGVYMTLAFWLIGAPAPLLLGPLIGVLFVIPFASAVAVPVVMLLFWLQRDGTGFRNEWWWIILAPIGVHIGGQFLDDYILTPKIQGDNTDLEMPTILFASLAGGVLGGVYGLLLAIPVAACLKILANEFVWPRIEAWVKGNAHDPLPIARE